MSCVGLSYKEGGLCLYKEGGLCLYKEEREGCLSIEGEPSPPQLIIMLDQLDVVLFDHLLPSLLATHRRAVPIACIHRHQSIQSRLQRKEGEFLIWEEGIFYLREKEGGL